MSEESMIERVSGALEKASLKGAMEGLEAGQGNLSTWDQLARAAIEAMREPTPDMLTKGDYKCYSAYECEQNPEDFAGDSVPIWQAMIDAALT